MTIPAPLEGEPLALFPVNTVLFPGGSLNLQIFEVRYLDLIGKCHKFGTPFGVVCLTQGSEVRQRAAGGAEPGFVPESFAEVGTLARIEELQAPQPGLLRIRCSGGTRFRILSRQQLPHGLWMGEVEMLPEDQSHPIPPDLQPVANALAHLISQQQDNAAQLEFAPIPGPWRLEDSGWVANRWCELLHLPLAQKQSLLQLESPLLRLELVGDWLVKKSAP